MTKFLRKPLPEVISEEIAAIHRKDMELLKTSPEQQAEELFALWQEYRRERIKAVRGLRKQGMQVAKEARTAKVCIFIYGRDAYSEPRV